MAGKAVFRRDEFANASLDLGTLAIDLADYQTTGVRIVTVGPSGIGKTNAGLLIAEQFSAQGWVSVLLDPEGEIEALYGPAVKTIDDLERQLVARTDPILVMRVQDAADFVPVGQAVMRVVDQERKPVFLMIDEGQIFSASRKRAKTLGEASDVVNDLVERGRKRSLDLFLSAHRFSGSLHRSVFTNKNLTLVGRQEDPTAWAALAPQFRGSKIDFADLAALAPGEFFVFSRRGVEKVMLPMAEALKAVAPAATTVRPALPSTFTQWDRAMRDMSAERLRSLTPDIVGFLGMVAGLSLEQTVAGQRAIADELETRPTP